MILSPEDPKIIEYINQTGNAKRPRGNQAGKKRIYKDLICAFDIETTTINRNGKNYNFMYSWALQLDEEITVLGRTWEQFYNLRDRLKYELEGVALCVFVHNLKYEFQYLKPLGFQSDDVIASDKREVIKAFSDPFEFRCSYRLTNLSLEKFTENVKHKKLSGSEFNYNKIRYPWTKLTSREIDYIVNDVLGLVEAIKQRNKLYNDSIYSMPITLTGYIRRVVRKNMRDYSYKKREKQKINADSYRFLAGAFRGGTAGANRYLIGEEVQNVYYYDISSAYTAAMMFNKYPMKDWQPINRPTMDNILKYIYIKNRAVIGRYLINGLRLKKLDNPIPFLGISKVKVRGKYKITNNKIIATDQIELFLTDIDLKILLNQYDFDSIDVIEAIKNTYDYLPEELTRPIMEFYENKTRLKGVDDALFRVNKELQNSIFGLCAQNPAKEKIIYSEGAFYVAGKGIEANILDYNKKAFVNYSWGVYTAAHCRAMLSDFIEIVGNDFVYCDTDGIYFTNYDKHQSQITELCNICELRAESSGRIAIDSDGVIHYLGAWEFQARYDRFKTLGVKKYITEIAGDLNITIAGVNKAIGKKELKKVEAFSEGFTFRKAAGTEAIYTDYPDRKYIVVEGKRIKLTPYIVIKEKDFTLGKYEEYKKILLYPEFWLSMKDNRGHHDNKELFI